MKKANSKNTLNFKLTNRQLNEIRKHLPYGFFTALAEKHDSISLRQMKEVMAQRSANADHNEIVWRAVKKKLTLADRQDLITLVDQRLSFCKNLLVV
jgi:hypothetical protein